MYPRILAFLLFLFIAAAPAKAAEAPNNNFSYSAKIVAPTSGYNTPEGSVTTKLSTSAKIYQGANVLLVLDSTKRGETEWLKLELPSRPNGNSAWVRSTDVLVIKNPYRITISRSSKTLTLFKNGKKQYSSKIIVGTKRTPTPVGTYAVSEMVPQPRGGHLGTYVIALTAHSNVHKTFDGGDGRIGVHGYEKLGSRLGTASSNGCIRMPNKTVVKLVNTVAPGTPVVIS